MSEANAAPQDNKLLNDMRLVIADAEELLRATAGQTGEKLAELRAKTQDHLAEAKVKLAEVEDIVLAKAQEAGKVADTYVRENPWNAVGIAAGAGFILGLLIGRR
jgi:ElaB/YqjD/DUF883 family membrane-anchored ribosome-binding protein